MKNTQKPYLRKIKGDASFRKFYRKKENKLTSIIIKAYREKEKNLLPKTHKTSQRDTQTHQREFVAFHKLF